MNIFNSLPQDLHRCIFQFLTLREIGLFDSAVTNSALRPSILASIAQFSPSDNSDVLRSKDFVSWVSHRKISLSTLYVHSSTKEMDFICLLLSQTPSRLRELSFHGCASLSNFGLSHLQGNLQNLLSADLSFCTSLTDSGLQVLSKSFHLRSLNLRRCWKLTSEGINLLTQKCRKIQFLCLSGCNISDECVSSVCENCPDLRGLDLSDCTSVTDVGLTSLSISSGHLEQLNLSCCKNITDHGVSAISEGCPRLSSLYLSYCVNISDLSIVALSKNSSHLAALDVSGCWKISDQSIPVLLLERRIREISLSGCCYITDSSLALIAEAGCQDIEVLDLSGILISLIAVSCSFLKALLT